MTTLEPAGTRPSLLTDGLVFAEGPRWHAGRLWFSDMHGEAVHTATLDGKTTKVLALPGEKPSGLGFLPDGSVLVVAMKRRALLRFTTDGSSEGASYQVHADLAHLVSDELNDMVVDTTGTAYVGSYNTEPGTGVIVRVALNGSAAIAATGLEFPNGTVITPDGRTLIVAESKGRRLTAFDLDDHGNLAQPRTIATTPDAAPDGIALDAAGAVWAAFPLAHEFRRILPGGEVTDRISTGERMAIACTLGGDDRRTLFLLSAKNWSADALAGARTSVVETLRVPVPGAGLP
ncbi:gluconolactonase [Frankia sp. CcI49]|uniref:SMP-30/gluconolactonase/LRE family protein n=1 Tax=Frankia sp. CcI49 TaxID=1745382 RepID=UPI0009772CEC|nr:SMP-30/gluconolactonase/LRE family protein [Frankia sp. CcI49]ONH52502.1 gluconolactonase [Frankia sp. CcI49]